MFFRGSISTSNESQSDVDDSPVNNKYKKGEGYHTVPPPYIGNYLPPRTDLSFAGLDDSVYRSGISKSQPNETVVKPIKAETNKDSDSDEDEIMLNLNHLIRDCNYHENKMVKKYVLNNVVKASDLRDARPVWNNAKRVNHQNFSNKWTHPHSKRKFVPSAVLANSGKISINTAKPVAPKPTMNVFNQRSNIFHKSHSLVKRPFHQRTVHKNSASTERVNTGKVNVTIVGNKAVVSTIQGNKVNVVKASTGWTWRPKPNVIDHGNPEAELKDTGIIDSGCSMHMTGNKSFLLDYKELDGGLVAFRNIKTGNLDFKDVYFVKELKYNLISVSQICYKKNSVLFTDTECVVLSLEFKLPDENQAVLRIPRNNNMYSIDLRNIVPTRGLTCLVAKASLGESNLWHRRLGYINFKTLNKLVKGNLVRGFPLKTFENDLSCVACQKGKRHKAS
ncbi:ribonuclease H-like domain-containing protein, partial [Tanacetum coccineum]